MSFVYVPNVSIINSSKDAGISSYMQIPQKIWQGIGVDDGLYAFKDNGWIGKYVISSSFHPSIKYSGDVLIPKYSNINGHFYWQGNLYSVFYSYNYSTWILSCDKEVGVEPYADYYQEEGKDELIYCGNRFYKVEFPSELDKEGKLTPRDSYGWDNSTSESFSLEWSNCWVATSQYDTYTPLNSKSTGKKYFGIPTWKDVNGNVYTKSLEKDENGYHYYDSIYGKISYNTKAKAWIIGTYGDLNGWWQSNSEPSKTSSCVFYFQSLTRSTAEPITLTYNGVSAGNLKKIIYLGEVSRWY